MLGLIGGALSGGAEAAQENAKTRIKTMHDKAMERMRQKYQTSEREAGQEFQSSEREAGQDFTLNRDETQQGYAQDNARLQHEMSMVQERYRQQQQNNRTAMTSRTKPQWQVVSDGEGGYLQYDPVSNTTRPVPEGVNFGVSNEISPRQEMIISDLQSQREIISKRLDGEMLDPEVQRELQLELDTVNKQIGRYLNPGSIDSGDLGAELDETDETLNDGPTQPTDGNQGGVAAPPRPGQAGEPAQEESPPVESGFGGLIGNAISDQQAQAQERQTEKQNDEIEQEINEIRSLSSRAGVGPGMTQSQRNQLARQAVERAEALIATGQLDDRQIERLQKAADNVVQYSDLELN